MYWYKYNGVSIVQYILFTMCANDKGLGIETLRGNHERNNIIFHVFIVIIVIYYMIVVNNTNVLSNDKL